LLTANDRLFSGQAANRDFLPTVLFALPRVSVLGKNPEIQREQNIAFLSKDPVHLQSANGIHR
jgi:hypothetical protein